MKKGYKECPFCKNEIKEESMKCEYCWELQDHPKCKFYWEIEYRWEWQEIYCPICWHIWTPKKEQKYNFFVKSLMFLLCFSLGLGIIWITLYDWRKEDRNSICKCARCGNTKVWTNEKPENWKWWWKNFFLFCLGLWIVAWLYFIFFRWSWKRSI